jgi:hypothetical protein
MRETLTLFYLFLSLSLSFVLFMYVACHTRRVNVALGEKDTRELMTGTHVVVDIFCNVCEVRWAAFSSHFLASLFSLCACADMSICYRFYYNVTPGP